MLAICACQPCSRTSRISAPAQRNSASSGWARTLRTTGDILDPGLWIGAGGSPFLLREDCPRPLRDLQSHIPQDNFPSRSGLLGRALGLGGPVGAGLFEFATLQHLLLDLVVDQRATLGVFLERSEQGRLGQELVPAVQAEQGPVGAKRCRGSSLAEESFERQVAGQVGAVEKAIDAEIFQLGFVGLL